MQEKEEDKNNEWSIGEIIAGIIVFALVLTLLWKLFIWIFGLKKRVKRKKFKPLPKSFSKPQVKNGLIASTKNSAPLDIDYDNPDNGLRWVFFGGRMVVVVGILLYNYSLYRSCNKEPFDWSKQLNYNEALILGYSLLAFILFGSVNKFSAAMKAMTISGMNWVKRIF